MYTTIIQQIKTILLGVKSIKGVYAHPIDGSISKSPSVVFMPANFENLYNTNEENQKTLKFKLWVEVDLAGTTMEKCFEETLPKAVDDVLAEFDSKWSSVFDGSVAWLVIDSGSWGLSGEETKGLKGYAELSLTFNVVNSI